MYPASQDLVLVGRLAGVQKTNILLGFDNRGLSHQFFSA